jgi:hypothetical protein
VIFTAQTMNDAPFSGVIDNALVVVHSDGTEIMNSARPAQDGSFCLGVWTRTGRFGYFINHLPWQGNDTENAPSGIGNPTGGSQITEKIQLSPNGNSYSGTFKLDGYDTSGHLTVSFTGVLTAKRITPSTSFSDLLWGATVRWNGTADLRFAVPWKHAASKSPMHLSAMKSKPRGWIGSDQDKSEVLQWMGTPRYETPLTFLLFPQTFPDGREQALEISKIICHGWRILLPKFVARKSWWQAGIGSNPASAKRK